MELWLFVRLSNDCLKLWLMDVRRRGQWKENQQIALVIVRFFDDMVHVLTNVIWIKLQQQQKKTKISIQLASFGRCQRANGCAFIKYIRIKNILSIYYIIIFIIGNNTNTKNGIGCGINR